MKSGVNCYKCSMKNAFDNLRNSIVKVNNLLFNVLKKKITSLNALQWFDSANGKWSLKDHLIHIKPNLEYEILLLNKRLIIQ